MPHPCVLPQGFLEQEQAWWDSDLVPPVAACAQRAAVLTLGHASIGTAPGLGALDLFCAVNPFSKYFPLHKGITEETSYVEIQL